MSSTVDLKYNSKCRGDGKLSENKRTTSNLQTPKVKIDRYKKSKLECLTDSRLPLYNKTRKPHNCTNNNNLNIPAVPIKPTSVLKRKSISLVELTSSGTPRMRIWTPKKWQSKEHIDELKIKDFSKTKEQTSPLSVHEIEIAKKVCKMFILNAWRRKRTQVSSLQNKLVKMKNEVDNLNIQVVVLRNLLESEKLRVAVAMSDAGHLKHRLENELEETSCLKNEILKCEAEKNIWKKQEGMMELEIHNLKGELNLVSELNQYLMKECENFEKTVLEMKEKEQGLQEELEEVNKCLQDRENNIQDLQEQSAASLAIVAELTKKNQSLIQEKELKEKKINECISTMKKMYVELNNSQNIRKVQNEKIVSLEKNMILAEGKVTIQAGEIENLKNTVQKYDSDKVEFRKSLTKARNLIVFEAVKIFASLFIPYHNYL